MKMEKKQESLFRVNATTGNTIIEISLEDYGEFFHAWDNTAFKKRDLHPGLVEFLNLCSADIPLRKRLEIQFFVKNGVVGSEKEMMIAASYHNFFRALHRMESKKIQRIFKFSLVLFLIALLFILLNVLLSRETQGDVWSRVLLEGLMIGGWVFMWEAFHKVFFESMDPWNRRRELLRFERADITFKYDRSL